MGCGAEESQLSGRHLDPSLFGGRACDYAGTQLGRGSVFVPLLGCPDSVWEAAGKRRNR